MDDAVDILTQNCLARSFKPPLNIVEEKLEVAEHERIHWALLGFHRERHERTGFHSDSVIQNRVNSAEGAGHWWPCSVIGL